jgi:hypothetical protein
VAPVVDLAHHAARLGPDADPVAAGGELDGGGGQLVGRHHQVVHPRLGVDAGGDEPADRAEVPPTVVVQERCLRERRASVRAGLFIRSRAGLTEDNTSFCGRLPLPRPGV